MFSLALLQWCQIGSGAERSVRCCKGLKAKPHADAKLEPSAVTASSGHQQFMLFIVRRRGGLSRALAHGRYIVSHKPRRLWGLTAGSGPPSTPP
ncbi:hypothetical protein AAFF_G00158010 [Aldrovandia affinis]|uniref:Uncharacterized protein n=1 Tax=Aldrovandia affinis TaxID=143900 RepID=A0AAD7RNG2_9TELE|nr:hypothetical protein AAFF_G00158010 [Aldrovandia affinis]